jgi:hypothetical protein
MTLLSRDLTVLVTFKEIHPIEPSLRKISGKESFSFWGQEDTLIKKVKISFPDIDL